MGKGDKRRPTAIDDGSFGLNWCRAMGHKMRDASDVCINCGMTAIEIAQKGALNVRHPKPRKHL
jgi:hypothetical protein